jgi:tetratricopeptide (TPR) repeat protein
MCDHVYSQIMGIVTRIQHYPGVSGLEKAKQKIKLICLDLASPCPPSITSFLEAYTYDRHDEIDKATYAYIECLAELTDDEILLRVYVNAMLASLYIDSEQYASAYDLYKEVVENIHLLDDNIRSLVYCNISDMYLCLEQYTQAVNYAKQGILASKNANHQLNLAICLLNLGYAYGHLQHFDDAIGFIHQAKKIAKIQKTNVF